MKTGRCFEMVDACVTPLAKANGEYIIACDPAIGVGLTVVGIRDGEGNLLKTYEWRNVDVRGTALILLFLSMQHNSAKVVIDSTGLGVGLAELLEGWGATVERVHFTLHVKDELVNHLAALIDSGAITYPAHPQLLHQLRQFSYVVDDKNIVRYAMPDGAEPDDYVSMMLLAFKDYREGGDV